MNLVTNKDPVAVGFEAEWQIFKKMFIAFHFLSSRDTEKLKTPLHFSRQGASKYVSGDLEKLVLKFCQGQDFWPWYIMSKFCDPTENTSKQYLKIVFPLTVAYGIRLRQAPTSNLKKCF